MNPTIEITIRPDGKTTIETKGFSGPSCRDATRLIETALGSRVSEQLNAEFFHNQNSSESEQQRA